MSLNEGETKSYAESFRDHELVIIDTSDPQYDNVVAIPEQLLAAGHEVDTAGKLPFRVVVKNFWPNANLHGPARPPGQIPGSALATVGVGAQISLTPLPRTTRDNESNFPAASIELVAPDGSLGTRLLSGMLLAPETFDYAGRHWRMELRVARDYQPFSLSLLKVTHDIYPGTEIPKNFSSRVHVRADDGRDDREALIYMNNPLRYRGLTFYQYQMDAANHNSVLQVVRNPSWTLPYVSCLLVMLGLLVQFMISLGGFMARRSTPTPPALPTAP